MKIQKYRRGIKQKGKFWILPDTWQGPFGPQDEVLFKRGGDGKWHMEVEFYRNDGDGIVVLTCDGSDDILTRLYELPLWFQHSLEINHKSAQSQVWQEAIARLKSK